MAAGYLKGPILPEKLIAWAAAVRPERDIDRNIKEYKTRQLKE